MKTVDVLKRAREILTKGWTRDSFARRADGCQTGSTCPDAGSWCAVGALRKATADVTGGGDWDHHLYDEAKSAVRSAAGLSEREGIPDFNDRQVTVEPVLAVFDKAIAKLEAAQ